MSWFSSWFSSSTPNATSATSPAQQIPPPEPQRLLEEPAPTSRADLEAQFQSEKAPTPYTLALQPTQNDNPNRNKMIFGAGVVFFSFSLLITRRAFMRKRLAGMPAFYNDAPQHHVEQSAKVSGAKEALEAFNLATLNVLSLAMMATGGTMWYLNINNLQDARKLLRGGMGVDGTGRTEQDAEEEFEEWMATVLARKDAKTSAASASPTLSRTGMLTNERGQQR